MPRPSHDDFRGDAKAQGVHNERPAGDMRCNQLPFREQFFMPGVLGEVHNAGRHVESGKFSKVFQVRVHLFVADDGQGGMTGKRNVLVFVKDGL